ncbi:eukaryotic translation initiation factor 4E [Rhodosporidiobolus nylandii]
MSTDASAPAPPADSALPPAAAQAAHAAVSSATAEDGEGEKGQKTVFDSPTDFTVKHPLYAPWTLWFDSASKQDKAKSWDEALTKVVAFESVEDFWSLYNNIVPPSLLAANSNYYLFKEGIKPAWEDAANAQGGKWSVQLPRGKYTDQIDQQWLYTMLAAIGETFETPFIPSAASPTFEDPSSPAPSAADAPAPSPLPATFSNEITGVIVSARKAFFRINIWTRSSSSPEVKARIENIGRHFKYGVLGFEQGKLAFSEKDKVSSDVEFVSHKDSQAKYGTKVQKWTV